MIIAVFYFVSGSKDEKSEHLLEEGLNDKQRYAFIQF